MTTPYEEGFWGGPFGSAAAMTVPEIPTAAETVGWWLINAPGQSLFWPHFIMLCVRLRDDQPGFPPPHHDFLDSTHELIVAALDPQRRYDAETFPGYVVDHGLPYLQPLNVRLQFIAIDDEMTRLMSFCAMGVVNGLLPAEPMLAGSGNRIWLPALVKTLAHIRGEEHAS